MPIKGVKEGPQYKGKAQQLTPEWWEMVRFMHGRSRSFRVKVGDAYL